MVIMVTRSERKWDHIRHALNTFQEKNNSFEDITFVHRSLPNSSLDQIQLRTKVGELVLKFTNFYKCYDRWWWLNEPLKSIKT